MRPEPPTLAKGQRFIELDEVLIKVPFQKTLSPLIYSCHYRGIAKVIQHVSLAGFLPKPIAAPYRTELHTKEFLSLNLTNALIECLCSVCKYRFNGRLVYIVQLIPAYDLVKPP